MTNNQLLSLVIQKFSLTFLDPEMNGIASDYFLDEGSCELLAHNIRDGTVERDLLSCRRRVHYNRRDNGFSNEGLGYGYGNGTGYGYGSAHLGGRGLGSGNGSGGTGNGRGIGAGVDAGDKEPGPNPRGLVIILEP